MKFTGVQSGPTIARIAHVVAMSYDVGVRDLQSESRLAEISEARRIAQYLSRTMKSECSYPTIARFFRCHHTSVIYNCRLIATERESSDRLNTFLEGLSKSILSGDAEAFPQAPERIKVSSLDNRLAALQSRVESLERILGHAATR